MTSSGPLYYAGLENLSQPVIQLYPNPVVGQFHLAVNKDLVGSEFYISDIQGRIIQHGVLISPVMVFDVQSYESGVYVIRLYKDGEYESLKFVK